MDNLIILANNVTQLKWLKSELEKVFEMSDLEQLHYCLEVEFEMNREPRTITINQRNYIEEVFKQFNMEKCKLVGTSFDVNSKLLNLSYEEFMNVQREIEGVLYMARVGSLIYAMMVTRANFAFAVSSVNQFMLKVDPPN